jgi:hypothetical protein
VQWAQAQNIFLREREDCTSMGYGHFILVHMNWGFLGIKTPCFQIEYIFKSFEMISKRIPGTRLGLSVIH